MGRIRNFTKRNWLLLMALVVLFSGGFSTPTSAADDYVVSVTADGLTSTLRTTGGTVEELLQSAGITYKEHDLIEPALDTEIKGPVFNVNIYRARPVLVKDGTAEYTVLSPYSSPSLIAKGAGVDVYREDNLELSQIDDILQIGFLGEQLVITRAIPVVIDVYGTKIEYRTHATTVEEVLLSKEINLEDADKLIPSLDTAISSNLEISLVRVGVEVAKEEEAIPFSTYRLWDSTLAYGTREVDQEGVDGTRLATYEVEYHNGKIAGRKLIRSVVQKEAVQEIVRIGTNAAGHSDNIKLGQDLAEAYGWGGEQWVCLYNLWMKESHWNNLAQNPTSTAYGIPQFLNGTWAGTGYEKSPDPVTQIQAGFVYITNRYGNPCNAWQHSVEVNWY